MTAIAVGEEGSSLVETSLSLGLLLLLVFGTLDICRALYIYHYLCSASRAAARYAMVRGASWSSGCASSSSFDCVASNGDVASFIKSDIPPGVSAGNLVIVTTWPSKSASGGTCDASGGTNSAGCVVNVQLTYPLSFMSPLLGKAAPTLSAKAAATIMQ